MRPWALALATFAACRQPSLPAPDAALRDASVRALRDAVIAPPSRALDAGGPTRDVPVFRVDGATPATRPGTSPTGIVRAVRVRDGAVIAWTADTSGASTDIVAWRFDPDGHPRGDPMTLHTVRGHLEAMDLDARHGLLWVAWLATTGSFGRWQFRAQGALAATDDLGAVHTAVRLGEQRVWPIARRWRALFTEVRAGDDGTALVLVSGDNTQCPTGPPVQGILNMVDCPGYNWYRVGTGRRPLADGRGGVMRPELFPASLTRVKNGWLFARGPVDAVTPPRVVFESVSARERVLSALTETVSSCGSARVAWTGAAFVMRCTPEASVGEPEGTRWVRAVNADGTSLTSARNTSLREAGEVMRCFEGRPVIDVRWDGGFVRVDPSHPDASLRLEQWNAGAVLGEVSVAAWAGRAIVGVDARGQVRRWGCGAQGEVEALP